MEKDKKVLQVLKVQLVIQDHKDLRDKKVN